MYTVEIKKRAKKELEGSPKKEQRRILGAFEVLRVNPFSGKMLEGKYEGAWSFRVWPYRIIYTIQKERVTVTVIRIGRRQGVYG